MDGRSKVTGEARYAAEFSLNNVAYGVIIQSTIANGYITRIDTSSAAKSDGVLAVLTHDNAPKLKKADFRTSFIIGEDHLVLQDITIYYAGQHIGLVVADTLEHATYAASLVRVVYEEDKPILQTIQGLHTAYKPTNFHGFFEAQISRGNVVSALSSSSTVGSVIIERVYTTPIVHHQPMESISVIADCEGDNITVYESTSSVMRVRDALSNLFDTPPEKVHVISHYIGGSFGSKGPTWQHAVLAVMASRKLKRPVKVVLTRQQMFTSAGHRPETIQRITLGASRNGKIFVIKHNTITQTSFIGDFFEPASKTTAMLYACDNMEGTHEVVRMNISTPAQMRAPGETTGLFALESAMDELACELDIDPISIREINYADVNPENGLPWSSKYLKDCYRIGADLFGWLNRNPVPRSVRDGRFLVGMGAATATYPGIRSPASARVRILSDGSAVVYAASQDIGTGTYTVVSQVAADVLGLPIERVRSEIGDSSFPPAPPSGGSQTTASLAPTVKEASEVALSKVVDIARKDVTSPLYSKNERIVAVGEGRLAANQGGTPIVDSYQKILNRNNLPFVEAEAKTGPGQERKNYAFCSFGAEFAEVKVDPDLGELKVSRFFGVFDVGRVINAKTSRNQVIGAIIQGIGMALMEQTILDQTSGRVVTNNLADYLVPVNADIQEIDVRFIEKPDPYISPIGARGLGEIGITGAAAAIANAVYNATGKRIRELPITLDKLLLD